MTSAISTPSLDAIIRTYSAAFPLSREQSLAARELEDLKRRAGEAERLPHLGGLRESAAKAGELHAQADAAAANLRATRRKFLEELAEFLKPALPALLDQNRSAAIRYQVLAACSNGEGLAISEFGSWLVIRASGPPMVLAGTDLETLEFNADKLVARLAELLGKHRKGLERFGLAAAERAARFEALAFLLTR